MPTCSLGFANIWRILHPWKIGEIHALVNGGGCWGVVELVFCASGWVAHKGGEVGGTCYVCVRVTESARAQYSPLCAVCTLCVQTNSQYSVSYFVVEQGGFGIRRVMADRS